MTAPIDENRRTSFDRNAALYDAVRPSYPDALVDAALARVPSDGRLLEIGAGTGQATHKFARHGRSITALEPGANMAAQLRAKQLANVTIVETTFEACGERGAFDLVYCAQAIHWIDPAVRYAKTASLLRPGGAFAIIWNEKADLDPALRAEIDAAYAHWHPEIAEPQVGWVDKTRVQYTTEIVASGVFEAPVVHEYPWSERYTTERYLRLLDTYSDHATMEASARTGLYAAIAASIDARGGSIELPYVAMLFLATRRG